MTFSRRDFVKTAGALAGGSLLSCKPVPKEVATQPGGPPDYSITIAVSPVELAPNHIISTTTYNGQFPGPLLRFRIAVTMETEKIVPMLLNMNRRPVVAATSSGTR